jgi:hypothetical protein
MPSIHYAGCKACYFTGYRYRIDPVINLPVPTGQLCPKCHGGEIIYTRDEIEKVKEAA